jgi:hypothetical protein
MWRHCWLDGQLSRCSPDLTTAYTVLLTGQPNVKVCLGRGNLIDTELVCWSTFQSAFASQKFTTLVNHTFCVILKVGPSMYRNEHWCSKKYLHEVYSVHTDAHLGSDTPIGREKLPIFFLSWYILPIFINVQHSSVFSYVFSKSPWILYGDEMTRWNLTHITPAVTQHTACRSG